MGLPSIASKGSLHAVPVFDGEVSVNLCDVLDEEPCVQLLLTDHIEHTDLSHQWTIDLRTYLVNLLRVGVNRVGALIKLIFEKLFNLLYHLAEVLLELVLINLFDFRTSWDEISFIKVKNHVNHETLTPDRLRHSGSNWY